MCLRRTAVVILLESKRMPRATRDPRDAGTVIMCAMSMHRDGEGYVCPDIPSRKEGIWHHLHRCFLRFSDGNACTQVRAIMPSQHVTNDCEPIDFPAACAMPTHCRYFRPNAQPAVQLSITWAVFRVRIRTKCAEPWREKVARTRQGKLEGAKRGEQMRGSRDEGGHNAIDGIRGRAA